MDLDCYCGICPDCGGELYCFDGVKVVCENYESDELCNFFYYLHG